MQFLKINSTKILFSNSDNNGYIDDIHGWNFLGNAVHEQLEMTRIVKKGPGTPDYDKAKAKLEEELKCHVDIIEYEILTNNNTDKRKIFNSNVRKEMIAIL